MIAIVMMKFFENIGSVVKSWIVIFFEFIDLLRQTLYWVFIGPFRGKPISWSGVFEQMIFMGLQSIVIVFFVTFFTGIVLAMQSAHQLSKMGAIILWRA